MENISTNAYDIDEMDTTENINQFNDADDKLNVKTSSRNLVEYDESPFIIESTGSNSVSESTSLPKHSPPKKRDEDNYSTGEGGSGEAAGSGQTQHQGNSHVVASHYNKLEEKGLEERNKSRIFFMRNFNNWIKSILITEYLEKIRETMKLGSPLRVLDMCCGKGGDLYKWEKGSITHLICTDIAEVSIEQCESRYKSLSERNRGGGNMNYQQKLFTAEFIACDNTRQRLRNRYKDPSIGLNLVSCQFAFHYCFESLKQAECMIKNAAECLITGGYFIGTIPDSNEIMRRQQLANSTTFGNDLYEISFLCDTDCPPLFGGKYNFKLDGVVNCPEYLVHFPLFVKLARKFGLQLVMKKSFGDYFNEMIDTKKFLIEKMQGLETYPSGYSNRNHHIPEDYLHAKDFLNKKNDRHKKCGTLSKSEWEAASLYVVFAFQKLKTAYNDKGEPVYEDI